MENTDTSNSNDFKIDENLKKISIQGKFLSFKDTRKGNFIITDVRKETAPIMRPI